MTIPKYFTWRTLNQMKGDNLKLPACGYIYIDEDVYNVEDLKFVFGTPLGEATITMNVKQFKKYLDPTIRKWLNDTVAQELKKLVEPDAKGLAAHEMTECTEKVIRPHIEQLRAEKKLKHGRPC